MKNEFSIFNFLFKKNFFSIAPDDRDLENAIDQEDSERKPDVCREFHEHCSQLHCPYGISRSYDSNNCERCECEDHCRDFECAEDEQCAIDIKTESDVGTVFIPVCRKRKYF